MSKVKKLKDVRIEQAPYIFNTLAIISIQMDVDLLLFMRPERRGVSEAFVRRIARTGLLD